MTDSFSDLYFAPTQESKANLLSENHKKEAIYVTGNTAIDALKLTVKDNYYHEVLDKIDDRRKIILVTMHRRENQGEPMHLIFKTLRLMVDNHPEIEVVYPCSFESSVQRSSSERSFG